MAQTMRLFLLPVSTRRTLIYCQRLNVATSEQVTWIDKGTSRAAALWASWEKKESGWQKKIVEYGNKALQRIPYEEWGLKSIPPRSARRKREDELPGKQKIDVSFPSALIPQDKVMDVLRTLGTERQALHKRLLIWSFVGMPISAPVALIPVIPNIPFFYLVFRAWSHWRALSGSQHIEFLLDSKLVTPKPSAVLDTLYSAGVMQAVRDNTLIRTKGSTIKSSSSINKGNGGGEEVVLLQPWNAKLMAKALEIPELEVELERAIWQVEKSLKAQNDLQEEKTDLDAAAHEPKNEKKTT